MAVLFVDDGGSNTSPFDTWAKAADGSNTGGIKAALADAACVAGSTVYVGHDSTTTYTAAADYASKGTFTLPINVISVTSGDETTYTTGAIEDASGGYYPLTISPASGAVNFYGITFITSGYFGPCINSYVSVQLIDCHVNVSWNSTGASFKMSGAGTSCKLFNTDMTFIHADGGIYTAMGTSFEWYGGTLNSNINKLVKDHFSYGSAVRINGVDLSAMTGAGTKFLFDGFGTSTDHPGFYGCVSGCKLAAANPPVVVANTTVMDGVYLAMIGCGSAGIPQTHIHTSQGDIYHETSIYRDNAATYDGTNEYCYKMVTNVNAAELHTPLRFKLADVWCAANPTLTIELNTDNVVLQDDEFWVEVEYPDSTVAAYRPWNRDSKCGVLTSPGNIDTSTAAWTESFGTEKPQDVDVTIASGAEGIHTVWCCLGKASTTVYVCPKVDVT